MNEKKKHYEYDLTILPKGKILLLSEKKFLLSLIFLTTFKHYCQRSYLHI